MRKSLIILVLILIAFTAEAKTRSGNYTMSFDLTAHQADEEVKLWIPPTQSLTRTSISTISVGKEILDWLDPATFSYNIQWKPLK